MAYRNRLAGAFALAAALGAQSTFANPALAQDGLLGSWVTQAETPMGNFEATLTLAQAGDGYTVEMVEQMPAAPGAAEAGAMPEMQSTISNVAVAGNVLSFDRSLETPQGPMEMAYRFEAEGDMLSGEATSSFGAIPITGTRAAAQ